MISAGAKQAIVEDFYLQEKRLKKQCMELENVQGSFIDIPFVCSIVTIVWDVELQEFIHIKLNYMNGDESVTEEIEL